MEKSYFFDAVTVNGAPDRVYSASDVADSRSAYLGTGVLSPDALKVRAHSGKTVSVAAGCAVIAGYIYRSTAQKIVSLSSASALPRIDLLVLRLDLNSRTISVRVVEGTPAAEPAAPAPLSGGSKVDLVLASVYMDASSDVIYAGDVKDLRTFSSFLPMENAVKDIVADGIGSLDILDADELDRVREIAQTIELDGDADRLLCADGKYRTFPRLVRTELARFTTPGTYRFKTSSYPSANGLYDIEMIGGGGAGGSSVGSYTRGGGGGAGAYAVLTNVRIRNGSQITVGAGGVGCGEADGACGGDTSAAGFVCRGGNGGTSTDGGTGGTAGCFCGESGGSGCTDIRMTAPPSAGCGASTVFGLGASNVGMDISSAGVDAVSAGCGGAGGGGPSGLGELIRGGCGAPGMVILYGYTYENCGEE